MTKLERTFMLMSRAAATLGVLFLLLVAAMSVADIVTRGNHRSPDPRRSRSGQPAHNHHHRFILSRRTSRTAPDQGHGPRQLSA
jgi:hypothetical protein